MHQLATYVCCQHRKGAESVPECSQSRRAAISQHRGLIPKACAGPTQITDVTRVQDPSRLCGWLGAQGTCFDALCPQSCTS